MIHNRELEDNSIIPPRLVLAFGQSLSASGGGISALLENPPILFPPLRNSLLLSEIHVA